MYLVCHRLISSWKADLNISLAALEFLTGLARIKIPEVGTCCYKLLYVLHFSTKKTKNSS